MVKLNKYQTKFFNYYDKHSKLGVITWDRQIGKTFSLIYDACIKTTRTKNYKVAMFVVGSFLPFLSDQFFYMFDSLGKSSYIDSHNVKMIKLINNSEILLFSHFDLNKLQGEIINSVYVDDIDFTNEPGLFIDYIKVLGSKGILTCRGLAPALFSKYDIKDFFVHLS